MFWTSPYACPSALQPYYGEFLIAFYLQILAHWNFKIIDAFSIYILKNENAHRWAIYVKISFEL